MSAGGCDGCGQSKTPRGDGALKHGMSTLGGRSVVARLRYRWESRTLTFPRT